MTKWMQSFLGAVSMLILIPVLHSQAVATGTYKSHIEAGAGVLFLNNDYEPRENGGLTIWADYDLNHLIGAEIEAHFGGIQSPDDIGENSYLVGPRIMYHRRKLMVYGKLMFGRGTISNQETNQSSTFNIAPAFGGGVEYHVTHKLNLRAVDVELQKWPNFYPHTLSPLAISVGLMYVIR